MRTLEIVIDHLPFRELSPNSRCHYMIKARAVKASKEEVGWLVKTQWHDDKPMTRAQISYEFRVKDRRHRDLDNLLASCKAYQDGLIEVGVIFYDDADHLTIGRCNVKQGDAEQTIIRIEEIERKNETKP